MAQRIAAAFEQPFALECREAAPVWVGASIGVAAPRGADETLHSLVVRSDEAMYRAKARVDSYVLAPAPD